MAKNLMISYVFQTKPNELKQMVTKYGLPPATSDKDLWKKINYIILKNPKDGLTDLVSIHPDKDIILQLAKGNNAVSNVSISPEVKSNACGCSHGVNGQSDCSGCDSMKFGVDGKVVDSNIVRDSTLPYARTTTSNETVPVVSQQLPVLSNAKAAESTDTTFLNKQNTPLLVMASIALVLGVVAVMKA